MTNIKTVKRVAKIGEKILITNPEYTMGRYEKGDTLKVKSYNDVRSVYAEGVDICILHEEYEVIIEEYDHAPKSLATRKQAEELLAELRRQAYAEGYEQGLERGKLSAQRTEADKELASNVIKQVSEQRKETAQQKRGRIVEQAKADIEDLKLNDSIYEGKCYSVPGDLFNYVCYAEFVVNKEKRTVVVLMRGYNSGEIYAKGIAKCAPGDCFNVHIGKAIALRRALGLEVPDEYLNAPQPTEVRVGDVVEFDWNGKRETVKEFAPKTDARDLGKAFYTKETAGWVGTKQVKIIDDSESIAP